MPRGDRTHLMTSEVPLMYGMVVEVVTVGVCDREFRLCEVWEWRWMKVAGYPFWARALETACSSCVLLTADDVRACAREYKVLLLQSCRLGGEGGEKSSYLFVWVGFM